MNVSIIRYLLGYILKIEAILLLLPCLVSVLYGESNWIYFLITSCIGAALGFLLSHRKPDRTIFYLKEGCVTTSLGWIVLSLLGCLPFYLSGEIPSFTDALFETISGFTTTGASILSDVEALSRGMLFWRSFTHWIGGMGILVFLLAIIPLTGGSNINLMRAESTGPSVGKLVPKVRHTARILYIIYIGMTVVQMLLLLLGRMPLFDAVVTSFGTAGTGGFGIYNNSIAGYSPYIQWVVTIFMILFGINFNAYFLLFFGQFKSALSMEEVRYYLLTIFAASCVIFFNILSTVQNGFEALTQSAFQVASIISSTGFSTVDFDQWNTISKTILVCLMFIGACAGSTGGGMKVSRFVLVIKTIGKELSSYIYPRRVKKIKVDGKPVAHEVVRSVNVYFITFILVFVISLLLISLEGYDLVTNFTTVATLINNIGPGLAKVGPTQNFGFFSPLSKYVMMFDMLAGRLELFPVLILLHPSLWREFFGKIASKTRRETL